MEALIGLEGYKLYQASDDPGEQRRLLIASWLYVRGLLETDFPHTKRFIPGHLGDDSS